MRSIQGILILRTRPDLVVLDVRLAGGTGMQVIQALRTGAHATSIVALTNYATPGYRKRYLDAGTRYFLDKTTELGRLKAILAQEASYPAAGQYEDRT